MKPSITFTLDLEDHRPDDSTPPRYPAVVEKILQFLDEKQIKGTFFTVGSLAEKNPELIKNICQSGHEIGHHSYDHTVLTKQTPEEFKSKTRKAKDILENITGERISGFRAPVFSMTRDSLWAVDILKELDFDYSSSVLPANNPLHGLPTAPRHPFKWSNGLLEIPAPVGTLGFVTMPYLGGFYLRYLPFGIVRRQIKKAGDTSNLWTYCHPYDFDTEEKNWRIKGVSVPISLLLWFNRKNSFRKLEKLAANYDFSAPFKHQEFPDGLPIIDPATL